MADEIEVDAKDLQETIEEIHREREEREEEELHTRWTKYIALSTAILAAFGAIAALESGGLANEGMIHQLQASDTWNEYQSSKQKIHLYGIASAALVDANVKPVKTGEVQEPDVNLQSPSERLGGYLSEIGHENKKSKSLSDKASNLQKEAEEEIHHHHQFAYSVALLQVSIALGAVSALTKMKSIWIASMALGIAGIVFFTLGFIK
jgi:hypothetical protein